MLKQDGKIHQPKRDKECTRTCWLTGRLNGVGQPWYLSGGVVLGRSVENLRAFPSLAQCMCLQLADPYLLQSE